MTSPTIRRYSFLVAQVTPTAPRLAKLQKLLLERPYGGPAAEDSALRAYAAVVSGADEEEDSEEDHETYPVTETLSTLSKRIKLPGLYSWQDLLSRVQASDVELLQGLHDIHAVEIDGELLRGAIPLCVIESYGIAAQL